MHHHLIISYKIPWICALTMSVIGINFGRCDALCGYNAFCSHIGLLPIQIWIFFCLFFLLCINILTDLATIEQLTTQNDNNHNLVRARTYSYCKLRGRNTNGNCFKRSIDRPFAHTASNSSTDLYWNKLSWHHAPHNTHAQINTDNTAIFYATKALISALEEKSVFYSPIHLCNWTYRDQ